MPSVQSKATPGSIRTQIGPAPEHRSRVAADQAGSTAGRRAPLGASASIEPASRALTARAADIVWAAFIVCSLTLKGVSHFDFTENGEFVTLTRLDFASRVLSEL